MHAGYGGDPRLGFLQGVDGGGIVERIGLHADHGGDKAEAVRDTMIDLMQQRFGAVAGLPHRQFVFLFLPLEPPALMDLFDRRDEQFEKFGGVLLDDIFVGAGPDRRYRGARVGRPRHVDDGRTRTARPEPFQHVQSRFPCELVIQRNDVEIALAQRLETSLAVGDRHDRMSTARQGLADQDA